MRGLQFAKLTSKEIPGIPRRTFKPKLFYWTCSSHDVVSLGNVVVFLILRPWQFLTRQHHVVLHCMSRLGYNEYFDVLLHHLFEGMVPAFIYIRHIYIYEQQESSFEFPTIYSRCRPHNIQEFDLPTSTPGESVVISHFYFYVLLLFKYVMGTLYQLSVG